MSSDRNSKHNLPTQQDDPVPQKKQCMDHQFNDESSLPEFTWSEDGSGSSGWQVSTVDFNDRSNSSTPRLPNEIVSDQSNQNKLARKIGSHCLNDLIQNISPNNTRDGQFSTETPQKSDVYEILEQSSQSINQEDSVYQKDKEERQNISPQISEQSQNSEFNPSKTSGSSVDSNILLEFSKESILQNSEHSQDSVYPQSLTPQNSISNQSSEISSREATPQNSSSSLDVEEFTPDVTPQLSEHSQDGSEDSCDYLHYLLYGPISKSESSDRESSTSVPTSPVASELSEDGGASILSNSNDEVCPPLDNESADNEGDDADENECPNSDVAHSSVPQSISASLAASVSHTTSDGEEYVTITDKEIQCDRVSPIEVNNRVDREAFMMKIMKTFKSNFLYDSFCYTLPRSEYATNAYKNTVSGILNLSDQCKFGLAEPDCVNFPSKESIDFAEGIAEDMRKRYKQMLSDGEVTENNYKELDEGLNESLEKEVDNDLPHNIVFIVSDGTSDIASTWCGQFQVSINPITNILSLRMFDYNPSFTENVRRCFCQKMLTEEVCKGIINEMEKFEISRQLRMDIDLKGFESLTFVMSTENEGLLLIKIRSAARFYQRFVNSSATDRNKWREREIFLPFEHGCHKDYVLMLGGVVSELSNIAARITVAHPNIKIVNTDIADLMYPHISTGFELKPRNIAINVGESVKLSVDRRNNIIEILSKTGLISQDKRKELQQYILVANGNIAKGRECNFLNNLEFHPCFCDFINYKCMNVSELEHHLSRRCILSEQMGDLESKINHDPDAPILTVAQFLSNKNDYACYYSFCNTEFSSDNMWHCSICGKCNQENEWHCSKCNKCSTSPLVCEHCGFDGRTFIIKPGSVDQLSQINPEWRAKLGTQDIPVWPSTINHSGKETTFNLESFMQDELGLIDPMAFLLGSAARGGGNRQGRRLQKYEKGVRGNPQLLAAAGCVLQ